MQSHYSKKTILAVVAFTLLLIGLITLVFFHRQLIGERDGLLVEIATLEQKNAMLKKSYSEQKTQAENFQRARQAAEVKLGTANRLLGEQEEQLAELQVKVEEMEERLARQDLSQKDREEQVRNAIDQWKAKVEEFQVKVREQRARIDELEALAATTKAALDNETVQHKGCREKNGRLAAIAQELATSYQKKGVVDILTSSEPLTQLKKVEMEKLVQEYLDRIDAEVLPKTGADRR